MPFLFKCPHCQSPTMVDDKYRGQTGECVSCGKPIQLPAEPIAQSNRRNDSAEAKVVRWIIGGVISLGILVGIVTFAVRYGGQSLRRLQSNRLRGMCMQNIEAITGALDAYARDYGTYPPPVTLGANGKKMHSWRVLILPYLGYQQLYDKYRMDEPWDSEHNATLSFEIPQEYVSPGNTSGINWSCNYFLVTGANTLFPNTGPLGPSDVVDDPRKTILVVESSASPLMSEQWLEPGDFDAALISLKPGIDFGGSHLDGMTIGTVEGTAYWLSDGVDPAIVRALLTPAGGEAIRDDILE